MSELVEIDEALLDTDLEYRYQYLCQFMGFTDKDVQLIHESAAILAPLADTLIDAVYTKLFSFSCTKQVFFRQKAKYDGEVDQAKSLVTYDQNAPQIGMRKSSLKRYLVKLLTNEYALPLLTEFDRMGRIHTPKGGKMSINVEHVHMNALMAFLQDAILGVLMDVPKSDPTFDAVGTCRAFAKVLAIQGDFISKHYLHKPKTKSNKGLVMGAVTCCVAIVAAVSLAAFRQHH